MLDRNQSDDSEQLLADLLDKYLAALERGEQPDREQFIAEHPRLANNLRDALVSLEFVTNAASEDRSDQHQQRPTPKNDSLPRLLGDYRIDREIGRGGMAVVYEAEQVSLGRRVALKVLPFVSVLDSRQLARFKNEAQAAALLTHQNIVPVYAVGCERSVHFFAMQFVDGQSLDKFIRQMCKSQRSPHELSDLEFQTAKSTGEEVQRPFERQNAEVASSETEIVANASTEKPDRWPGYWQTVTRMAIQACDALDYAHCQGVVHRDIKPGNLMLDTTGNLWVTDFGLARVENDMNLTMTGDVLGTLRYMSPEQAMAKRPLIDHRSDIYSLGVTLFELLTLEPAIKGIQREEVIKTIAFEEPRQPRKINAQIPRELDTIVGKAIAKHPNDRYQTAKQMGDDLRRFLDDKPILAKPPTIIHRVRKWTRRHKVFVGTALVGLAVSLLVGIISLAYSNRLIDQERESAIESEAQRREQLVDALVQRSAALRRTNAAGRRQHALEALRQATNFATPKHPNDAVTQQLRNEAIACLVTEDLDESRFLTNPHRQWINFDRQLTRYSMSDERNDVTIWSARDNELIARLPGNGSTVFNTLFSPDGRYLAAVDSRDHCAIWDLTNEKMIFESPLFRGTVDFHPQLDQVSLGQADGSIRVIDLGEKKLIRTIAAGGAPQAIRYSPDGKRLAVAEYASTRVQILDMETGSVAQKLSDHVGYLGDVCWNHDGRHLAVGCLDGRIYLWDMIRGKVQAIMHHQLQVIRVRFSPDGELLASTGHDGVTRLWRIRNSKLLASAKGHFVKFDPTGRFLAYQTKRGAGIWQVVSDPSLQYLVSKRHHYGASQVTFEPQGRLLASAGNTGAVLWDVLTGAELATIPLADCGEIVFDSDGNHMFTASRTGLYRWPIVYNQHSIQCGPPRWIANLTDYAPRINLSANNRYVAFVDGYDSFVVMDLQNRNNLRRFAGHPGVYFVSMSPNLRWAATSAYPGRDVMVWDMQSGQKVTTFLSPHDNAPTFSPDNQWLATVTSVEYRFYEVGTWELKRKLPLTQTRHGGLAFSPNGTTVAIYQSPGSIHLLDAPTGNPIGVLELPDQNIPSWLRFSSDGSALAAATADRICVWHFHKLRDSLRELQLDWPLAFLDEANSADKLFKTATRVEIDLGDPQDLLNHPYHRAPQVKRIGKEILSNPSRSIEKALDWLRNRFRQDNK